MIVIVLISLIFIFNITIMYNETIYMFIFDHRDWKLWQKLNNTPIEDFEYLYSINNTKYFKAKWFPEDWELYVDYYNCFITNRKNYSCILSDFYKKGSKKLRNKLINNI